MLTEDNEPGAKMKLERLLTNIKGFRIIGKDEDDDLYYAVRDCSSLKETIEVVISLETMERRLNVMGISHDIYDSNGEIVSL